MDSQPESTYARLPAGTSAVLVAVLALVLAAVALLSGRDDQSVSTGDELSVELTEFAITPATVRVPQGGSLRVTNGGSAVHNLTVRDADIATADLAAGESEVLDLSSLAAGEYELQCSIPGHADASMTATLTIGAGGATGATGTAGGGHQHQPDYAQMDTAMQDSIAAYPAETEGVGNQLMEPEIQADGTKQFELTAAITPWEVEPGKIVDAWTYNGMAPGPSMRVAVGDRVRIVVHNELPMGTDLHLHGINVPNPMDGSHRSPRT
jgi:plastocyanin